MNFDQAEFEVRCEWGEKGVLQLAPISDVVVINDRGTPGSGHVNWDGVFTAL